MASSVFAHHYSRNRGCFLFLRVLRCFTSPRYLHLPYVFRQGRRAITPRQVSPFGNPRIDVWLPTPRGLSQVPTSFFGFWCQGIHRVPLLTWQLQMMLASTVQFSKCGRSRSFPRGGSDPVLAEVRLPRRPVPQDPTACSIQATSWSAFRPASGRTNRPGRKRGPNNQCSTNERPPWNGRPGNGPGHASRINPADAPVAP